ncbi:MAG: adenylate/guanylate cyclase domain-containing protein [Chloroflexota bacterium]|nr:adenylate/guanylate cyclase domain-containing protein [Chloroflexota bacterium]
MAGAVLRAGTRPTRPGRAVRCADRAAVRARNSRSSRRFLGLLTKTFEHGIVRFLANLARVYEGVVPIIEKHGGVVTTRNADNLLAVYRDTAGAVRAAGEVHRWLRRRNARLLAPDRFELCIGIHHGPVLRLRDDVYGAAVNVCAKIGEDIANAGETLVTDTVVARAPGTGYAAAGRATIGGRSVRLHRVLP